MLLCSRRALEGPGYPKFRPRLLDIYSASTSLRVYLFYSLPPCKLIRRDEHGSPAARTVAGLTEMTLTVSRLLKNVPRKRVTVRRRRPTTFKVAFIYSQLTRCENHPTTFHFSREEHRHRGPPRNYPRDSRDRSNRYTNIILHLHKLLHILSFSTYYFQFKNPTFKHILTINFL